MNRSTADSGRAVHAEVQLLLPWLLAGTLEGAELAMVQEHIGSCEQCRADLARERKLRAAGNLAPPALDPDQALARLLPRLEPQAAPAAALPRRPPAANDGHWLRALAAAQLGVIAVLALLLAVPGQERAGYRGLGASAPVQGNLVVVFDPATPERELRRIVQASQARVVGGPTVTDAYVLAVPPAQAGAALRRLRAEPGVRLAQPLGPEGQP
jgi:anti-sigma factor RsiW